MEGITASNIKMTEFLKKPDVSIEAVIEEAAMYYPF